MPQILRSILAIIAGFIVGAIINLSITMINVFLFLPTGTTMRELSSWDKETMMAVFSNLPPTAFLLPLLAHIGGTFVGAWLAAKIAGRAPLTHGLIIGAIVLLGGIANLNDFPHPLWFAIVDLALYLPAGWLGGKLVGSKREGS